jgi:hypothetical protein
VEQSEFTLSNTRGRRLLSAAVALALVSVLAGGAHAQRFVDPVPPTLAPPAPLPGTTTGIGGGAGLALPQPMTMAPAAPTAVMPMPSSAPPVVAPSPAPAAPVEASPAAAAKGVRFRCDLTPEDHSCKEAGTPDGGGDDSSTCDCARDFCHDEAGPGPGETHRVCDKLQ